MEELFEIGSQSLHVWIARLPALSRDLVERRSLLGEAERGRADRFTDKAARERYLAVHVLFHLLLAGYIKVSPAEVVYRTGALGAPRPLQSAGGRSFCWSLSYRDECAAVAVSADGPVGVDIERVDADALPGLTALCLGGSERAAVDSLPGAERTLRIFQLWTIKEAVLKRAGLGLSIPPGEIGVELADVERPAIVLAKQRGEELVAVRPRLLDTPDGYVGAVAMDPELSEALVRPLDASMLARTVG